jgi:5-methylcytosine-specific restriction endonuclease McrA
MNTQPLLLDSMKVSPVSSPMISPQQTPRSSFMEGKVRTSSTDNPINMKGQRVYPQLFTISSDSTEKEVKDNTTQVTPVKEKKEKEKIPRALREQVWLHYAKKNFEIKCPVVWCENRISPFDFHVGHNIAEANGGTLDINNLKPICSRCNLSMGSQYTIDEWNKLAKPASSTKKNKCIIM